MKHVALFAFAALAVIRPAEAAAIQTNIVSAWIEYVPGGQSEVRAIVRNAKFGCPFLITDPSKPASDVALMPRAQANDSFPLACALVVPKGTTHAFLGFRDEMKGAVTADVIGKSGHMFAAEIMTPIPDIAPDPQRILVLGDTGCRIKGTALQACNDPKAWPFPGLAKAAAAQKPNLVIHLGDYLYRESACPAAFAGCAGSPWGDNWASWDADFFTPAAPLLAAAPWIVIRGNHEDCYRAGPGFLRLLGPSAFDPAAPCEAHIAPYAVPVGGQLVAVMDSSSASDTSAEPAQVQLYQKDFEALKAMANVGPGRELWLATHRPLWGAITFMGAPAGGNATMIKAAGDLSAFNAISLMLSGHIHTFEAINYEAKVPPQIVAGNGGDNLDVTPIDLRGTVFQGDSGVRVRTGFSVGGFGFMMLTRVPGNAGWTIMLYDSDGHPIKQCAYQDRSVFCLSPG
jgi:hypothetical protein